MMEDSLNIYEDLDFEENQSSGSTNENNKLLESKLEQATEESKKKDEIICQLEKKLDFQTKLSESKEKMIVQYQNTLKNIRKETADLRNKLKLFESMPVTKIAKELNGTAERNASEDALAARLLGNVRGKGHSDTFKKETSSKPDNKPSENSQKNNQKRDHSSSSHRSDHSSSQRSGHSKELNCKAKRNASEDALAAKLLGNVGGKGHSDTFKKETSSKPDIKPSENCQKKFQERDHSLSSHRSHHSSSLRRSDHSSPSRHKDDKGAQKRPKSKVFKPNSLTNDCEDLEGLLRAKKALLTHLDSL